MDRFGFIFHPLDLNLYADGFSELGLRGKRALLVEGVMKWLPPFKRSVITGIKSLTGKEIQGDMILVSLLPEQIITLDNDFVLDKVVKAGKLAEKLGDKIIGLGAYMSQVGRKGILVSRNLKIPVTTGSSYTVTVAIEATLKAAELLEIDLTQARIAVIGASGAIGSVCSKLLARQGAHMVLVARNYGRLLAVKKEIAEMVPRASVEINTNIYQAIKGADIILTSTSTPMDLIDLRILKPGTLICDISRPKNVSESLLEGRDDVLIIEGGIVRPPGDVNFHFSFGLPPGLAYACIAETMLLTLEQRYEDYSIGGNISIEKAEEMGRLAKKHGFRLAELMTFNKKVTMKQIARVKESRTKA